MVAIGGISGYFAAVFQAQQKNGPVEREAQYKFKKMLNEAHVIQHNIAMEESLRATYALKKSMRDRAASDAQATDAKSEQERFGSTEDKASFATRLSQPEKTQAMNAYKAVDTSQEPESLSSISAYS